VETFPLFLKASPPIIALRPRQELYPRDVCRAEIPIAGPQDKGCVKPYNHSPDAHKDAIHRQQIHRTGDHVANINCRLSTGNPYTSQSRLAVAKIDQVVRDWPAADFVSVRELPVVAELRSELRFRCWRFGNGHFLRTCRIHKKVTRQAQE
jgi:hypothetical protein